MTKRALTVGLLAFVLLLAALITRNGNLAFLSLPFIAYLGIGILFSPAAEEIRLTAERSLAFRRADGASAVDVCVLVRNPGSAVGPIGLRDRLQPSMTVTEGALRQWAALESGEESRLRYTFQTAHGCFQWNTLHVTVSDPLGLFELELELPAAAEIVVRPKIKRFRSFPLRPDGTLRSPGLIPAHRGGSGTDFWGVREYNPGDPLRRLDWRRTARHPRRLFTKELEEEQIADIGLILDARPGSDARSGEDGLFEHTLGATVSLAEMFLRQGNRVGLLVLGDRFSIVYPGYGKVQLNRILGSLAGTRPGERASHPTLEYMPQRMFGNRALIVMLGPFVAYDLRVFPRLRARGNQGLLISPDPIDFTKSGSANDPAGRLALRVARLERRLELRSVALLGIRVIDWRVHEPLLPLVGNALRPTRGRGR